jgi:type I restriction enzyme S subunit
MIKNINILKTVDIINNSVQPYEGERKYLDTGGLKRDKIEGVRDFDFASKPSRANQNVEIGDIILARMKDTIKVKIISKIESDYMVSTGFIILKPKKNIIDNNFLNHFLLSKSFQRDKDELCSGATQKAINNGNFKKLEIPLPPLDQQKKIAAILDAADTYRQKTKALITKYDELTQSLFLDMFGNPVRNPKKWRTQELITLGTVRSGITKGRKFKEEEIIGERPYMRVANVQDGHLDLSVIKTIPAIKSDLDKFLLMKGDILLTEGGDPDKLGRGAVWNNEIEGCLHQNHIFKVRLDKDSVIPIYFSKLCGSAYGKRYFLKVGKQTTGIATINKTQLSKFPVYLPPIDLQNQFGERVKAIEVQKTQAETSLARADHLFNSLLQRAFKGELTN